MRIRHNLLLWFVMPGVFVVPTAVMASADDDASSQTNNPWSYSLAAAALRMPEADLDLGGRTSATSYHFRAAAKRRVNSSLSIGTGVNYDAYDRDFSGDEGLAALEPWNRWSRLGLNGSLRVRTRYGWSYGVRPFVTWSSESSDLDSDAMSYGAAVAVVTGTSRERRFGVGASVSRDLDDSIDITPIIILNWEISENWAIGNPHETHFTAPAGLEISYRSGESWRFAVGGVFQSSEFRLDNRGLAPDGIGESDGILSFVRISRQWPFGFAVNAFVGAVFNGELAVEDTDGVKLASDKYDTAPFAAVSIEGSF